MYTSHGHQIEGTPVEGKRPPVARCGGPKLCNKCAIELARATLKSDSPSNYIPKHLKKE